MLIVYSAVLPRSHNESFADLLIKRLELDGSAADAVRMAFAPPGAVESSVTALGVFLLIVAALSFTRTLQRLYELVFSLPTRGMRNTKWGIVWLLFLCLESALRPVLVGQLSETFEAILSLTMSALLWLITPYLLLGRRLHWRRLVPVALLSTIGMTGVGIWSVLWLPHTISTSAQQYGIIGIGFALLAWLVAIGGVLVVADSGGAVISDRIARRHEPKFAPAG
jgi:membrane protein